MIALPGLCLATGRFDDAKQILRAFAQSVDRGMLPNGFPDKGEMPEHNTVAATLWFFIAVYLYLHKTDDPNYRPNYGGDPFSRDSAYHPGTVWSWLVGPFVNALIAVDGARGKKKAMTIIEKLRLHLKDAGVGSISEIFDAEAPHQPRGCIAQAWSVGEVLRVYSEHRLYYVISDKKFTAKEKYQILRQWKYNRDVKETAKRHGITPKILKAWKSRMNCAREKKIDPKGLRGLEDDCPFKEQCCPNTKQGRIFRTHASDYPFLDWNLPRYGYHRQVIDALRLANERIISRLKEDLASDKLYKQNDFNVEAHACLRATCLRMHRQTHRQMAKSLVAQHIFAAVAFSLARPEAIRRIKTFHSIFQRTS